MDGKILAWQLSHRGEKNINFWAFAKPEHAAMAFDTEARKRARPDSDLNFPQEHPTGAQIESWKMNTTHYTLMGTKNKSSSQYRGGNGAMQCPMQHEQVSSGSGKDKWACSLWSVSRRDSSCPGLWSNLSSIRCFREGIELSWIQPGSKRGSLVWRWMLFLPYDKSRKSNRHPMCFALAAWRNGWIVTWCALAVTGRDPISTNDLRTVDLIPWQKKVKKRGETKRKRENTYSSAKETPGETAKANEIEDSVNDRDESADGDQNKTQLAILKIQMANHCWKWEEEVLHVKNR